MLQHKCAVEALTQRARPWNSPKAKVTGSVPSGLSSCGFLGDTKHPKTSTFLFSKDFYF